MDQLLRERFRRALEQRELAGALPTEMVPRHRFTPRRRGMVALAHEGGAWIEPATLVPVLEETGMIDDVGVWLFERAA
ncbi:MAG: hypothetical protein IRZ28_22085 [Steroidobacteraceae bacterium]|nr:hypothetical protein [Steroidobacteraceae bacterium]